MPATLTSNLQIDGHPGAAGSPQPHFMILPSLACPARCGYCFGPHQGPIMSEAVADAAVELARGPNLPAVAARLVRKGICRTQASGEVSLNALWRELYPPTTRLNNLYPHLTWRCQLQCDHCYARADAQGRGQPDLPVADQTRLLREAKEVGFRQVILTGGEPLMHRDRQR